MESSAKPTVVPQPGTIRIPETSMVLTPINDQSVMLGSGRSPVQNFWISDQNGRRDAIHVMFHPKSFLSSFLSLACYTFWEGRGWRNVAYHLQVPDQNSFYNFLQNLLLMLSFSYSCWKFRKREEFSPPPHLRILNKKWSDNFIHILFNFVHQILYFVHPLFFSHKTVIFGVIA